MSLNARLSLCIVALLLSVGVACAQQPNPSSHPSPDFIYLDVVVTPKNGSPVSGLQAQDFTLLDNKVPVPINSFQAVAAAQPAVECIVVIDDVNTGLENVAYERSEIDKFLLADGGHLAFPAALAFLTDSGIQLQDGFSKDGKVLSASLHQHSTGLHTISRASGIYGAVERFQISLDSLLALANREASRPGRKFILWISPGWPLLSGPGVEQQMDDKQRRQIFSDVVQLSTLLRQGRVTLYSIDPLGTSDFAGRAFYWQSYVKGVKGPNQADWGDVALQVLAVQSGGLALNISNDIYAALKKCTEDAQSYYELSFAPPLEHKPSEYHQLEIRIDKSGLTARTRLGYYSQP